MGNTKLGFMNVPNGDVIAFDMKESEINPSVVYLSHDDVVLCQDLVQVKMRNFSPF